MMRSRRVNAVLVLVVVTLLTASAASVDAMMSWSRGPQHQRERTIWDSVYSAEQAERGDSAYKQLCARCHMENLAGSDEAVELTGSAFVGSWSGQSLADLHDRIRTSMPTDTPGVYGRQQIVDVMAYMLRCNGFPAGAAPLTHESDVLREIRFLARRP